MAKKRGSTKLTKRERAEAFFGDGAWRIRGFKRLGLPPIRLSDGPCGLRVSVDEPSLINGINGNLIPATCYPAPALMACSFDEELLEEVGREMGKECRAHEIDALLAPTCNIKRNPLCGRNFEYYSEDPLVTGKMAAAFVRGIQSEGVGACIKHFAANSQESYRMVNNSVVDERALREIYLKPFEIAVKESDPWMVMGSYNRINGVYACDNKRLLDGVLRKEWGFKGVVISDWGATSNYIYSHNNGLDIEMPGMVNRKKDLFWAISNGSISRENHEASGLRIQRLLERNLKAKSKPAEPFSALNAHELAVKSVVKSAVLLKNEGVLPLRSFNKTCIIGRFADEPVICGGGSSKVNPAHPVSFLEAARARKPDVPYCPGYDFIDDRKNPFLMEATDLASKSDKVILFLGLNPGVESEGFDREDMQLPVEQRRLFDEIYAVNPNIIVVLNVGSPVELPFLDKAAAILLAYLPGQGGGEGIAKLLLNEVCPSGRLAETWPIHLLNVPSFGYYPGPETQSLYRESIYVGYRYYVSVKKKDTSSIRPMVAFPFGFGLSYARISYSDFSLSKAEISKDEKITVKVDVSNRSKFPADHLVEIYINPDPGKVFRPDRYLAAFRKIHLEPESKQTVIIELNYLDFAHYDLAKKRLAVESGGYAIELGNSAMDIVSSKRIKVNSEDTFPSMQYTLPVYYTPGSDGFLSYDSNFEALLGHEVVIEKDPHSPPYDVHSTIEDISETWIGKILIKKAEERIGSLEAADKLLVRNFYELPLRCLCMDGIKPKTIAAIVHFANGKFIRGALTIAFGSGRPKRQHKKKRRHEETAEAGA